MNKLGIHLLSSKCSGQYRKELFSGDPAQIIATASSANTDTVDYWLTGNTSTLIEWSTGGSTTNVPLTSTPTKYSHTYTGETPNITLTNQSKITGIIADLTSNFTTTTSQINTLTSLTSFVNIDALITGSIDTIDNAIIDLSLGDQVGNDLLTGDIGTLLNNNPFTTLNLNGGDLTVSDVPISVTNGAFIYLKDNQISDAEVDILVIRSVVGNPVIDLTVIGNTTGARTSSSDTEYNQHITNTSTIELNGTLIGTLTYSNTSQTVNVNVAITTMADTSVISSTSMYQAFNKPTGILVDAATGAITGTPTVIDEYTLRIRKTGYGDYAGVEVIDILISVLA